VLKGFKSATTSVFVRVKRFTCLTAMSADGLCGDALIVKGACDMEMFTEWFATEIVPNLEPYPRGKRCVVVMDNCAIHNKKAISELCSNVGAIAVFLPPYSPTFNPIEQLFGKLKQFFRSNRDFVRQVPSVGAIRAGLATITAHDCKAWIRGVQCYNTAYAAYSD
jgi:transposase